VRRKDGSALRKGRDIKRLRCEDGELEKQEESTEEMQFFTCKECGRRYARGPGGELHDRWLSALSLILYSQIFVRDPRTTGTDNARRLAERWPQCLGLYLVLSVVLGLGVGLVFYLLGGYRSHKAGLFGIVIAVGIVQVGVIDGLKTPPDKLTPLT